MKRSSGASKDVSPGAMKPIAGFTESLTPKGAAASSQYQPTMFTRKRESYQGQNTGKNVMPHGIQSPYLPQTR